MQWWIIDCSFSGGESIVQLAANKLVLLHCIKLIDEDVNLIYYTSNDDTCMHILCNAMNVG